jgi:DNA-directed RNA polymerase specialized sigma24 family protein
MQEEQINSVLSAIENHLPTHLSKTLKLRYKENYSNDQIADAVPAKKRTIIKYISDGLKMLREILNRSRP